MCAAGLAVLGEVSQQGFLRSVVEKGEILTASLAKLANEHRLGEVRGRGLLQALALGKPIAAEVAAKAFEAGVLLNAPRPDALRFMPSLILTQDEIDHMVAILDGILGTMHGGA
jgi:acetylornithine/N-succinyldiaminopimelate aminotransferase